MYHISIYFDQKTEARMRDFIGKVAEVTGNAYMQEASVPPHITLSALECEEEEKLVKSLETLMSGECAVSLRKGTLQWVSVGCFLPGVIFLQPVLNEYLQDMTLQVYHSIKDIEGVKIRPCYQPFSWLPHSTIAKKLTPQQLRQAFQVLQQEFSVVEGKVVRIGLAKMNPHREIMNWELKTENALRKK